MVSLLYSISQNSVANTSPGTSVSPVVSGTSVAQGTNTPPIVSVLADVVTGVPGELSSWASSKSADVASITSEIGAAVTSIQNAVSSAAAEATSTAASHEAHNSGSGLKAPAFAIAGALAAALLL